MYCRLRTNVFCHKYNRFSCIVPPGPHTEFRVELISSMGSEDSNEANYQPYSEYSVVHSTLKTPKMAKI